jgi:hypothetical protein
MSAQLKPPPPDSPPPGASLELWAKACADAADADITPPEPEPVALARVEKRAVNYPDWIEANVYDTTTTPQAGAGFDFSNAERLRLEPYQRRILNAIFAANERGRYPYSTVYWSQPKKSGKTQIAGAVGACFAENEDAPNLVLTIANNQEQGAGRIFSAALPAFDALGYKVPTAPNATPEVTLANGTKFRAIPNNAAGQAGANYGLTLWSEIWGFTTERQRRLYDELTPVPTRRNSIRWIETYAGFEDQSALLLGIFSRIFTDTSELRAQPKARPVPGLEDIQTEGRPACWHIPEEGLFAFIDHELRMPWHHGEDGQRFIRAQEADLRRTTFVRLWRNFWQSSVGGFLEFDWVKRSIRLKGERATPAVFAADASQRHDTTSLVGVESVIVPILNVPTERFRTTYARVWNPGGVDIDLEATLAAEVLRLYENGLLLPPFYYDPTQMHQVAINLRKKGVPCQEFPQGSERMKADTFLFGLYKKNLIDNFENPDLISHLQAAKAKEDKFEHLRIVKGELSKSAKIDAAVAQSMAAYKASIRPKPTKPKKSSSTSQYGT